MNSNGPLSTLPMWEYKPCAGLAASGLRYWTLRAGTLESPLMRYMERLDQHPSTPVQSHDRKPAHPLQYAKHPAYRQHHPGQSDAYYASELEPLREAQRIAMQETADHQRD